MQINMAGGVRMRTVKPSGDFLVPVVVSGHDAVAKVSDFAKGAGLSGAYV